MNNPVYFSAPGCVCAAGLNAAELWHAVTHAHQNGIVPVRTAAGDQFFAAHVPDSALENANGRYNMHIIRLEEAALRQIATDIELAMERYGAQRVGVCVGSCDNGSEFSLANHRVYFEQGEFPETYELEMQGADYVATFVQELYHMQGPVLAFSTACSSSAGAIIKAAELIQCGAADAVVAGGVDIASDTVLKGFNSLEAISPVPTNPFSKNRRGISLGDGAAFFVLSKEPLHTSSAAVVLAGYGESADAHHMTAPDPQGIGATAAMKQALQDAGISANDIDYVNLHGTGTKFNDAMEAEALKNVFGGRAVPCSSTKSITGHTLGAAGALEAAICYETLVQNENADTVCLPQQVWDGQTDSALPPINIVDSAFSCSTVNKKPSYCMSNSFAFGGSNVALILHKKN